MDDALIKLRRSRLLSNQPVARAFQNLVKPLPWESYFSIQDPFVMGSARPPPGIPAAAAAPRPVANHELPQRRPQSPIYKDRTDEEAARQAAVERSRLEAAEAREQLKVQREIQRLNEAERTRQEVELAKQRAAEETARSAGIDRAAREAAEQRAEEAAAAADAERVKTAQSLRIDGAFTPPSMPEHAERASVSRKTYAPSSSGVNTAKSIQERGRNPMFQHLQEAYPQGMGQSGDIVHKHPANIRKNRAELNSINLAPQIDLSEQHPQVLQKPYTTRKLMKGDRVNRVFAEHYSSQDPDGEVYGVPLNNGPRTQTPQNRKQRQRMRANKLYDAELKDLD